jgi:malate synthase
VTTAAISPAGYAHVAELHVHPELLAFVNDELLPVIGRNADEFWAGFGALVHEVMPRNRALLAVREKLQRQIDGWHRAHPGRPDAGEYEAFLREIGYLRDEPAPFQISTVGVDPEISEQAGPQLVVPVSNPRFVLNAVNARWGSLYDALYGSDVISEDDGAGREGAYKPVRGSRVVAWVRGFLDEVVPLARGSHVDVRAYRVVDGGLVGEFADGTSAPLAGPAELRGYRGEPAAPEAILIRHNRLHIEIVIDRHATVGSTDLAGVQDVIIESAITTIVDFEDSVAAVDAADKVNAYRNWLELNRGTLTAEVGKGGRSFVRTIAADRAFTGTDGAEIVLPGRSVLYVRNVGHLMTTDAVLDADGQEIGEGLLDAVITTAAALPGVDPANPYRVNRTGSIYIVKPKMHGADEVALCIDIFAGVENLLGLEPNTVKLGLMDEERRMSVNLAAGIHAARERLVFINTGFLDRSGDEIHTLMEAGPVVRKAAMKAQHWILSYEDQNVDIGLAAGLSGHAQIGKGMWAMPDLMADMVEQKIAHPRSGATTAWVPSPTAATLHALHYHRFDPAVRQAQLGGVRRNQVGDLLDLPLLDATALSASSAADRRQEVDSNVQSLLGYVVRWVDQGIGCSKVPDIHDVGLMEDRATLRISSQLLANWLRHGVISAEQVSESLRRMALVVDAQNNDDPAYLAMAPGFEAGIAFAAAEELIFAGTRQPNGYTEPILHRRRREFKASRS